MKLDPLLKRFRLASRDLFNQHYLAAPSSEFGEALQAWECFEPVEEALFQTLVVQPGSLSPTKYGALNLEIDVVAQSDSTPIMINREDGKDHGSWDFPITKVDKTAIMKFVTFFDFDRRRACDHQYVHVEISDWPSEQGTVGRRALIENQYVSFRLSTDR